MNMELSYESLFSQIESSVLQKYPLLSCCMKDGILFPEAYAKSSLKIAFILKEPYAEWNASYYERVKTWEPVVREQLKECIPDIVFYGNTWDASSINPIEPNVEWQEGFCTNQKKYGYTSDGGNKYHIFIAKYRETDRILINGYHPELGNASRWQTDFIKDYIKKYLK